MRRCGGDRRGHGGDIDGTCEEHGGNMERMWRWDTEGTWRYRKFGERVWRGHGGDINGTWRSYGVDVGVTGGGHGRGIESTGRGCEEHREGTWRRRGLNVEWMYRGRGHGGDVKGLWGGDIDGTWSGHGKDGEVV